MFNLIVNIRGPVDDSFIMEFTVTLILPSDLFVYKKCFLPS